MASSSSSNSLTVQAISAAVAGALSPLLQTQSQQQRSAPTVAASTSERPNQILPSYLKRRISSKGGAKVKKPKTVTSWDRDIVCLPKKSLQEDNYISYPRGKFRARLGRDGLVGKVHLTSVMTVEEVAMEIRSVFEFAMGGDSSFPFKYLQATGGGVRALSIPSLSSSFQWTAQQVAKLGNQRHTIYILAEKDLKLPSELDNEDDEGTEQEEEEEESGLTISDEPNLPSTASSSKPMDNSITQKDELYRSYVDLVVISSDSDDENLPDFFTAITQSIPNAPNAVDLISLKHILQQHQRVVISSAHEEDVQRIHVRRSHIFEDSFRQFSKDSFDVTKMLKVIFVGESAIDDGGPRREFFQLLLNAIASKSGLFGGFPDHVVLLHNVSGVLSNKYFVIGKMISTALVQGGQPPVYFAGAIADFLVYNRVKCPVDIDDIADFEVRECLQKITEVNTTEDLHSLLNDRAFDFRFACGYTKPTNKIELKDASEIAHSVWLHYVLFCPHAELEQLRNGFQETLRMKQLVCLHEDEIRGLLAYSPLFDVTVEYLLDLFVIQYSLNRSNNRTKEEAIVIHWFEYITNCKDGRRVSLGNILQFFSGASKVPATGFDEAPKIAFTEVECLPHASTCALSITFPRSIGCLSYNDFEAKMDLCILGSFGFGNV